MSTIKTMENGEVRKLVRFPTKRRRTGSRSWRHKWVVVRSAKKSKG